MQTPDSFYTLSLFCLVLQFIFLELCRRLMYFGAFFLRKMVGCPVK